jgi:AraC-like DNA-binding protein
MNTSTHLSILSIFIIIGLIQGFILSFFFIKKSSASINANLYQGLLILALSLCIFEQWLNITGYITHILIINNSTEWLNLTIGPFLYLYVKKSIDPAESKKDWMHLIPAFIYLGYLFFDLLQPIEIKYNSYIYSMHPDWPRLDIPMKFPNDPLNLKEWLNLITGAHVILYVSLAILLINKKAIQSGGSIFRTNDEIIRSLRNMVLHITIVILIFIIVKLSFQADLRDYYIGFYVSIFLMITSYRVMNDSTYFESSESFMDLSIGKYSKSSLSESGKQKILDSITNEFETNKYYSDNLASLSELAKKIGESPHHVSQVINEKMNKNFFELLAAYRIEEAKKILSEDRKNKFTIEEISEMVGYNSKTAFNNAFKKISGKTPSEFRKSLNQ